MARPRQFTDDQVLDAARDLLADPKVSRPTIAEISIHVRHGARSRAIAARLDLVEDRWRCSALQFG